MSIPQQQHRTSSKRKSVFKQGIFRYKNQTPNSPNSTSKFLGKFLTLERVRNFVLCKVNLQKTIGLLMKNEEWKECRDKERKFIHFKNVEENAKITSKPRSKTIDVFFTLPLFAHYWMLSLGRWVGGYIMNYTQPQFSRRYLLPDSKSLHYPLVRIA